MGIDDPVCAPSSAGLRCRPAGARSPSPTSPRHRSGLPALPRGVLLPALTHASRRPLCPPRRRHARGGDPAHPSAPPAGGSLSLLELRSRTARPSARPARRHELRRARAAADLPAARPARHRNGHGRRPARDRAQAPRPRDRPLAPRRAGGRRRAALDRRGPARLPAPSRGLLDVPARRWRRARRAAPRTRPGEPACGARLDDRPARSPDPYELLLHEGGTGGFRSFAAWRPRRTSAWSCSRTTGARWAGRAAGDAGGARVAVAPLSRSVG